MNQRIIREISEFVFVEDPLPQKADAIFLPGGSYPNQPERAAEIWKEGRADWVVPSGAYSVKIEKFSGPKAGRERYTGDYATECAFFTDVLRQNGVAPSAILEEAEATHTWDNARLSRLLLDQKGVAVKRGIICCKGFHARRSLQFYSFAFPEAEFYVQTVPYIENGILIDKDTWHQTEAGVNRVMGELKRLGTQFTPLFLDQLPQ